MNRRAFNSSLLGGAAIAAMPIGAAASVAKSTSSPLYAWAVAIARAQNRASPAMLAQQLRISQPVASELYASMIANGAIRAPILGGVAKAAHPLFKGGQLTVVEAQVGHSAGLKLKNARRSIDRFMKERETDEIAQDDQAT